MSYSRKFGSWGEDYAENYLIQSGYSIIARNIKTAHGEIFLIAKDGGVSVFVEVKSRSSHKFGYPEEAITKQKMMHMLASAQDYLQIHPEVVGDWRLDILAIERRSEGGKAEVTHFKNVIHDL
jgi:putative endonuclease